ncbi:hypothetical protein [Indiicoccus explosivorum]|uniref:hypothetical protein n=1 Tax=Indiicoccus explosivorum TaxID=1917864 RepID=UPI001F4E4AF5|nr:hypothetical protein [Indiicoccus explosivorum]
MRTRARPLDRALYEYLFESGSRSSVLAELGTYQNPDGGFGNGLEPDFRCQASSALATSVALQVLTEVEADASEEMVNRTISYLLNTYDEDKKGWQIMPREVETAPRAPWWNYSEDWPWGNPSAELIGYFHRYSHLVPAELLERLTEYAICYINNLEAYDHHELLCFIRLADQLPEKDRKRISGKLREMAAASVTTDPAEWNAYCLLPLQVAQSPASEFYELFKKSIPQNIEFLIRQQHPAGYWDPTWSWGQFEQEWEIAKEEWRGRLTVENLRTLRSFGRI